MNLESRLAKLEARHASPKDDYWQHFKGLSFEEFWDKIGRPEKNGIFHPIYDYETELYNILQSIKYLWVKKATGLGITEFMLRYMAWLCLKDDAMKGKKMCIFTGPRIDLAEELIHRIKDFFQVAPKYTQTEVWLNGCHVGAYPSHHLDAARGLTDVKLLFLDEGDFFPPGQQDDARHVSERYIAKSDPHIVMVSTPNVPGGLFEKIEQEPEQDIDGKKATIYRRVFLPYTRGLGTIYTHEEIEKAKRSPSFEREYNLKYGYGIGNVFHAEDIDKCCEVEYDLQGYRYAVVKLGIDPAFGTLEQNSKFAFVTVAMVDGMIRVYDAEQHAGLSFADAMKELEKRLHTFNPDKIYVDGANPVFIKGAKAKIGENEDYELDKDHEEWWKVRPISFSTDANLMLGKVQSLVSQHFVQIHPDFKDLILQMRMAQTKKDTGKLDKDLNSLDLLDAFMLALRGYSVAEK